MNNHGRKTARAALVVLGLSFGAGACRQDMHDAPRYDPLEASSSFSGGASARPLVAGTVARGHLNDDAMLMTGIGADGKSSVPFLAGNIVETEFDEPVFPAAQIYEKGGVRVGVIGQAFPYTPIANPRWMMSQWSFGIREEELRRHVKAVRDDGADLIVLLSHNGYDVDRKLAGRVDGIDGLYLATAFSGSGFKIAPAVGQCMAELVIEGRAKTVDIEAFRLRRFAEGRTVEGPYPYAVRQDHVDPKAKA